MAEDISTNIVHKMATPHLPDLQMELLTMDGFTGPWINVRV